MVRTKDLLLFVVILVMLFMAISATVASRIMEQKQDEGSLTNLLEKSNPEYSAAVSSDDTQKRTENIARLSNLISQGDVIESSPSVEASPLSESSSAGNSLTCSAPNTGIEIARTWPLEGVEMKTVGATRIVAQVVYAQPLATSATGTPTEPIILSEKILLQLPAMSIKQAESVCLDSEIVGITLDGSLIFNNDAILYRNTNVETLIGYARDGFPIYGTYMGEQDPCGGYDSPSGYRYVASPTESTFMSCFVGSPRNFNQ